MHCLDFTLLPDLFYGSWMINLGSEVEEGMQPFVETLTRAQSAIRLCYELACSEAYSQRKEAFFRGALAEFISMEETLERDLRALGLSVHALKLTDSNDPLLHIAKALRNLETHVQSSGILSDKKAYWFGPIDRPEVGKEMTHEVRYIQDITAEAFSRLRNAKNYRTEDVIKLLAWFNEAQKLWGVYELIRLAILRHCKRIIDTYSSQPPSNAFHELADVKLRD